MSAVAPPQEKVLIVGPSWVGDMVMAQSLFKLLQTRDGSQSEHMAIDIVAPPWSSAVAWRMPEVSSVHNLAVPHGVLGFGTRRRLAVELRAHAYDRAIVLPGTFKSAFVPWWARIPRRSGYRGEQRYGLINDMRELDREVLRSTAERYCALGLPAGSPLPPPVPHPELVVDDDNRKRLTAELDLHTDAPVVALCPGAAFGSSKRWPVEHFAELAGILANDGCSVWILGSPAEAPLGAAIVEREPAVRNLCGQTGLVDVVDVLAMADATVSNDSGLLHIAAAVGSRVTALYGSTPPWFAPPLTHKSSVHYAELGCSPCFKRECPLGHHDCMRLITPATVAADVMGLIET